MVKIVLAFNCSVRPSCAIHSAMFVPLQELENLAPGTWYVNVLAVRPEFRGLGLKRDAPEERAQRVFDHNMIWGPFGRNLHEDLLGVHGQGRAMREGTDARWVIQGREEHNTIHDEVGMRHYYAEWSRRMGRPSYDPGAAGERAAA